MQNLLEAGVKLNSIPIVGMPGEPTPNDAPKMQFRENEPASPALKDNPYSPGEVSKRQSQLRRELNVEPDPDVPIPDQKPGKNIKEGVHKSEGKKRHITGEKKCVVRRRTQ